MFVLDKMRLWGPENADWMRSIYYKTRKPTEGIKSLPVQRTEDRRTRFARYRQRIERNGGDGTSRI